MTDNVIRMQLLSTKPSVSSTPRPNMKKKTVTKTCFNLPLNVKKPLDKLKSMNLPAEEPRPSSYRNSTRSRKELKQLANRH